MTDEDCDFRVQEQFGRVYREDDFFNFQIQVLSPDTVVSLTLGATV